MLTTIIMAGGLGKRMRSETPKVLQLLNEKPLLYYVILTAIEAKSDYILIVVGKYRQMIQETIVKYFPPTICNFIHYCDQKEIIVDGVSKVQGTGDAVKSCLPFFTTHQIPLTSKVLILSGDVPLIKPDTIRNLLQRDNSILVTHSDNPFGCGRVLFSHDHKVIKIIEEKDCSEEQRNISHINCGIYCLSVELLFLCIPLINSNNKNNEYYLTDIVQIANEKHIPIKYHELPKIQQYEIININTPEDLFLANRLFI